MISLEEIGTRARWAEPVLRIMGTETKNSVMKKAAEKEGVSLKCHEYFCGISD